MVSVDVKHCVSLFYFLTLQQRSHTDTLNIQARWPSVALVPTTFKAWLVVEVVYNRHCTQTITPFTAKLAAPSLWKRPTNVPNLKPLRLFFLLFFLAPLRMSVWEDFFLKSKMPSTESRLVIAPSNIVFGGVYVWTFQPGRCTGWSSEGVRLDFLP